MSFSAKSITAVILVLGSIFLGYFVVLPRYNAYNVAKQALAKSQSQEQTLEAGKAQMEAFLSDYNSHIAAAQTVNYALPLSKPQVYDVLNSLSVLAQQSGMALGSVSITDTPESDTLNASSGSITPIDLQIGVSGDYLAFKNFLTALETNLRLIDVNSLTVQSSGSGTSANALSFAITARTYYQQ